MFLISIKFNFMLCIEMAALLVTSVSAEGNRKVANQQNSIGKLKIFYFAFFLLGSRKIAFKNTLLNVWDRTKVELYNIYSKAVYQIVFRYFFFAFGLIGIGCKVFCHTVKNLLF